MHRNALVACGALVFVGCTFGLGDYTAATQLGSFPDEDASGEGRSSPGDGSVDSGGDADPVSSDSGPCTHGTSRTCQTDDVDGGVCTGSQQCIQGSWASCIVERKCPATWSESTAESCKKVDPIGTSPEKWTTQQQQGGNVILWSLTRALPFDTYGQDDKFCFVPKQRGNCWSTSTSAVEVRCLTGAQRKLSGNDFEDGWIHNKEFCLSNSGPDCQVVDTHGAAWTAGAVECERWFELTNFRVEAAPRCAAW